MNEKASAWEQEDAALLAAVAREQDAVAYRALFDRYYARVFAFVNRRLSDRELSREVVSDVFFEVWSGASGFRGESKISSWIFGIARFKSLEAVRNRGRLKRSRVTSTDDEVISQVAAGEDVGTRLDARHELERVASALDRLPVDQREALEWVVVEGLGIAEVAQRQRVTRDTVKSRISRARKGLRRMLGASEGSTA